jgi:hypothetical protein
MQKKVIYLAVLFFATLLGCKHDMEPINYVDNFQRYSESFVKDEWGLSNPTVKAQWSEARKNKTFFEFAKNLKNAEGKSFYDVQIELLQSYSDVETKLIKPGYVNKEMLMQAVNELIKEKKTKFSQITKQ